jgi:hypothetical protein
MAEIVCPWCGAPVKTKGTGASSAKPYCLHCGWNVENARRQKDANLKQFRWVVVILLVIAVSLVLLTNSWATAILAVIFTLPFFSLLYRRERKELRQLQAACASAASAARPPASAPESFLARALGSADVRLAGIPRPRTVRLSGSGKVLLGVMVAFAAIVVLSGYNAFHPLATPAKPGDPAWLLWIFPAIFALVTYGIFAQARRERQYRHLLVDGEIAMARILTQHSTGGKAPVSKITFEFLSCTGESIRGEGYDYSWRYHEDMAMPVFYDPQTREAVGICGTRYEIVAPG